MLTEKDYCDYGLIAELEQIGMPIKIDFVCGIENGQLVKTKFYPNRPSLYEAQKFLREEKKLFIEITIGAFDQTYLWEIYNTENSDLITGGFSSYNTYEEALSEGLREAVKILKEK